MSTDRHHAYLVGCTWTTKEKHQGIGWAISMEYKAEELRGCNNWFVFVFRCSFRLMWMCRWKGSHFHDWGDYNAVLHIYG